MTCRPETQLRCAVYVTVKEKLLLPLNSYALLCPHFSFPFHKHAAGGMKTPFN
jgi:hypothetical protein